MAKKKLYIDEVEDFLIWGVLSSFGGHKLSWDINQLFQFKLARNDDIIVERRPTNENLFFNYYTYEAVDNFFRIELIKNKNKGEIYLKELKSFDYLLLVKGELDFFEADQFSEIIKKLPSIQSIIKIDQHKIKNIAQLILE